MLSCAKAGMSMRAMAGMSDLEASLRVKWVEVGRFMVEQWVDALLLVSIVDVDLSYTVA